MQIKTVFVAASSFALGAVSGIALLYKTLSSTAEEMNRKSPLSKRYEKATTEDRSAAENSK